MQLIQKNKTKTLALLLMSLMAIPAMAQTQQPDQHSNSIFFNGVFLIMLSMIVLLMFVIIGLLEMIKGAASFTKLKNRELREKNNTNSTGKTIAVLIFLLGISSLAFGQNANPAPAAPDVPFTYWGMGGVLFWSMFMIIALELIMIGVLFYTGRMLLHVDKEKLKSLSPVAEEKVPSLVDKWNAAVAIEEESTILMDHDYDGIKELDNNLPPWWKYGFYATILFAFIYLLHFHVFETGSLSAKEYEEEMLKGKHDVEEYRKGAANLVDETNVTQLTDPAGLAAGADIFKANCEACHSSRGEGKVGPNLTDKYWLYKGGIKDVFSTIKYGKQEKGMKSWKDDLGPLQIQQVASYIRTLTYVSPADGGLEPAGDLYSESTTNAKDSLTSDSLTKPVADSLNAKVKKDSIK